MSVKSLNDLFTNKDYDITSCRNTMAYLIRRTIMDLDKITPSGKMNILILSKLVENYIANCVELTGERSKANMHQMQTNFIKALKSPVATDKIFDKFIRMLVIDEELDIEDISLELNITTKNKKEVKTSINLYHKD